MKNLNNGKSSKSFLDSFRHFSLSVKMLCEGFESIGKGIWCLAQSSVILVLLVIWMISFL